MSKNLPILLFTASVLLASFAATVVPQARALTNSEVDNSHVTARFTSEHRVCGNHLCAPGERTSWEKAVWDSQKVGYGKVGTTSHGENVMHKLAGSTPGPTTEHGTPNPMTGMQTTKGTNSTTMSGMK